MKLVRMSGTATAGGPRIWNAITVALLLASASAAPAYANPFDRSGSPIFEFKGVTAGSVTDLKGFKCRPAGVAKSLSCVPSAPLVAGRTLSDLIMNFYEGKFASMEFRGKPSDFWPIADAFTAKYGIPCLTTENWLGIEGNTALNWCFRTGILSLEQTHGRDRTHMRAFYYDEVVTTPIPSPKIDF